MKILLTGFKPFGKNASNPSLAIIEEIKKQRKESIELLKLEVVYGLDGKTVIERIQAIHPDLVLSFGLAAGRSKVCLEAVALNVRDGLSLDNQGQRFSNEKISDGSLAYASTLNLKQIKEKIDHESFMISYSAGTFVCNDVYYQVLDYIYKNHLNIACGFVHIPYTENENKMPYLASDEIIEIVMKIIDIIVEERECLK